MRYFFNNNINNLIEILRRISRGPLLNRLNDAPLSEPVKLPQKQYSVLKRYINYYLTCNAIYLKYFIQPNEKCGAIIRASSNPDSNAAKTKRASYENTIYWLYISRTYGVKWRMPVELICRMLQSSFDSCKYV